MKKLFLGLGIVASTLTFAQSFGIKGGMNVSSATEENGIDDSKAKIGFNAGIFLNAPISSEFSIQPEILYSQYGNKVDYTFAGTQFSSSRKLDYIAIPLMFQYNATPQFYLEAGPEFGFMVSAKDKTKNESTGASTESSDFKDDLNTFNFGVGIGAGIYFTPKVALTARYVAGFTDIYKDNSGDAIKNNLFQVGLAFKLK